MDKQPEIPSLRQRTVAGVFWSGVGNYGSSAVRLLSILALGWLLPPGDFGLLALAFMFILLAEGIGELGMVSALVQQKESGKSDLDSAFWLNLLIHIGLGGLTVLLAEPITTFLGNSEAASLLRLLSIVFLINPLAIVPRAVLIRNIQFRRISMAQLAGEIAFGIVGLTLAWLGFGAWSLGGAILAQRTLNTAVLWSGIDWRPGLAIDLGALRRLIRFGGPMMGGALLERGLVNVDYFVIGRFLGTEALGYYSLAFQLAMVPLDRLVGITRRVAFPAFSRIQDDVDRLTRGLLEGVRHLFAAALPIVLAIVVLGPWLLEGVYGEKWAPSIPSLRILGIGGLFLVPRVVEAALLAIGKPRLRLWLLALRLAAFVVLVSTVGLRYGIVGVAGSVSGALVVWAGAALWTGRRELSFSWTDMAAALGPVSRAGLLALAPLAIFLLLPAGSLSPWIALAYSAVSMNLIYILLVYPLYKNTLRARLERLRMRFRK